MFQKAVYLADIVPTASTTNQQGEARINVHTARLTNHRHHIARQLGIGHGDQLVPSTIDQEPIVYKGKFPQEASAR